MREVGEEKIKSLISDIFIAEVKPATGCTEVGTIGFACSYALNAAVGNLNGKLETIKKIDAEDASRIKDILLTLDPYLFKNAADVGIPKTAGGRGIKLAAALGLFGNPAKNYRYSIRFPESR